MDTRAPKLLGLELLRFLSAVAVLFWHYQHFTFVAGASRGFVAAQQPFYPAFSLFYDYGLLGVPVFWTISGFIFFWKYGKQIADGQMAGRKFFVLRFSRLYPLHLLTLLLVAALQQLWMRRTGDFFVYQANDVPHFLLHLFMASNWFTRETSFNGPIWSISAEVLVYALFFFSLRRAPFLAVWVGVIGAAVLARLLKIDLDVINCAAYFYAGCMIAYCAAWPRKYRLLLLLGAAAAGVALYPFKPFASFLLGIAAAILLLAPIQLPRWSRAGVEFLGNLTYSSYLLHFPVQLGIMLWLQSNGLAPDYRDPRLFFVFMGITAVVAALAYRYFEMPAQTLLRTRWGARDRPALAGKG